MKVSNNLKNLSSYPILNNYRRDYVDASFAVELIEQQVEFDNLKLRFKAELKGASELERLIKEHKAYYYVHVECSYTCFRKCYKQSKSEFEISIPTDQLSNKIEVSSFIITTESIFDYKCKKLNPMYGDLSFDIDDHQIMAIGSSYQISIENDDNRLDRNESIIKYRVMDDKNGFLKVITDDDYIIVGIPQETFDRVALLGKSTFPLTVMSLIIIPTMTIVLGRMHDSIDDENLRNKHWFQVIETFLNKNKCNIENLDVNSAEFFDVIQKIFKNPIANALKELQNYSDRSADERGNGI